MGKEVVNFINKKIITKKEVNRLGNILTTSKELCVKLL